MVSQSSSESSGGLDGGVIEQLIPAKNSKILQQDQVGIDLQTGYSADLAVNGVAIPEDQLTRVSGLDEVLFQPGPGKVFEQWPAGQNCVVATYWANDVGPTAVEDPVLVLHRVLISAADQAGVEDGVEPADGVVVGRPRPARRACRAPRPR